MGSSLAKFFEEDDSNQGLSSSTSLSEIFEEEPVPLNVFIQDKKYLSSPALSPIQFDAVQHIERVYMPETYPLMAKEFHPYWKKPVRMTNYINICWGKGSGKDMIARVAALRVVYLLLCLSSPQEYFGMPAADSIHLLNIALEAGQAQRNYFAPMIQLVKRRGNWFEQRAKPTKQSIEFAKNIEAISGHSEAESQEGLNLILGVADEIDGFKRAADMIVHQGKSAREPANTAEYILKMMRSSGASRFPGTHKQVRISYPRYVGSMIQTLVKESESHLKRKGESSNHYFSGPYATWVVNPRVTRENFQDFYDEDPIDAAAKFECKPSHATNPFFRNEEAVHSAFRDEPAQIELAYINQGESWSPQYEFSPQLVPIQGAAYAMHADLAVKGDRAGIAMSHVVRKEQVEEPVTDPETGFVHYKREFLPVVKVDFAFAYESDIRSDPPREIQIRWARELCFQLQKLGFNIRQFTFDGFQCLTGDTRIPLLNGTTRSMRELSELNEDFWVYSIENGRVVPGKCTKAWKTGTREDLVEVTLDNGEKIKCTSDHLFMMRDGSYSPASSLKEGDSLMPFYRRDKKLSHDSKFYEQIYHPEPDGSGQRWRFTHSMVSHYFYGKTPKGWVTHHKDLNPKNNTAENLLQLSNSEHSRLHREMSAGRFKALWEDPKWASQHRTRLSSLRTAEQLGKTGRSSQRFKHSVEFEQIDSFCKSLVSEGGVLNRTLVEKSLNVSEDLILNRLREQGFANWKSYKWSLQPRRRASLATAKSKSKHKLNHKVVSVARAEPEDVYDLQVEKYHNFALSSGVFVHNSTDSMQILNSHGIESSRVSTDLTTEPYLNLRDLVYSGRCSFPESTLLKNELLGLVRLSNGKIDHTTTGSKDLSDAVACSVIGALKVGGSEDPSGARAYYAPPEFQVGKPIGMAEHHRNVAWEDIQYNSPGFTMPPPSIKW